LLKPSISAEFGARKVTGLRRCGKRLERGTVE
jgi:hypothetical protein